MLLVPSVVVLPVPPVVLMVPSVAVLLVPSMALLVPSVVPATNLLRPSMVLLVPSVALLVPPHAELVVPSVAVLASVAVPSVAVAELPATKVPSRSVLLVLLHLLPTAPAAVHYPCQHCASSS